jgi:outer membrane protein OmpA-like peptidoglycan-associated protein
MKLLFTYCLLFISIFSFGQKQFEVYFDFNKDFPNKNSILEFNTWKNQYKINEIVKLEGYCDSVDSKSYNKKLAERRIESVVALLHSSGIKISDNIKKIAVGKDFIQSALQEENRKVILYFTEEIPKAKSELYEKIKNAKVGETVQLPNIYFYNNSARIVPKSQPVLYDLLCVLEENAKIKFEIQGHICCQIDTDVNDISTARAKAIYNFLIRNKIDRNRMTYKGYGTSRPIHKIPERNETEANENRRVEIVIIEN